jgi:adenosylhomocysteine nucleosidase
MSEARYVVMCAMESEAVHLRRVLDDQREEPLYRWRRTRGALRGTAVEIVVTGIGMAYAAAATSAALIDGRPRAVVNYGCAGAHREDIHAGDVVLGERVVHLASYVHRPDDTRHYFGFRIEGDEGHVQVDALPGDPALLAAAAESAGSVDLPHWPGQTAKPAVHRGAVGSADIWTQHHDTIRAFHDTHGTLCEEMEAAAIAQICAIYGVPFLAIKDISNNELQAATSFDAAAPASGYPGASLLDDVLDELGRRAALLTAATITHHAGVNVTEAP